MHEKHPCHLHELSLQSDKVEDLALVMSLSNNLSLWCKSLMHEDLKLQASSFILVVNILFPAPAAQIAKF